MGYSLLLEPAVQGFLFNRPGLRRADRLKLYGTLNDLREHCDAYRNDESRRLSAGSEHFSLNILFRAESGEFRNYRLIVSDAAATYGVLRIVTPTRFSFRQGRPVHCHLLPAGISVPAGPCYPVRARSRLRV